MLSYEFKRFFYVTASPFMRLNGLFYKYFRAPKTGTVKVHLGPGTKKYVEGWINVDANMFTGKCDLWTDIRYPLPFHDGTVDAFYSYHVVEHLPELDFHFQEVFRCLKPGGVYRCGGPNGDVAIQKFIDGDKAWFPDFPTPRESIGGRFENFIFCKKEHLTILTSSFLSELLETNGFREIKQKLPVKETDHDEVLSDIIATESEANFEQPRTLLFEAVK